MYLKTTSPQFMQFGSVSDTQSQFPVKKNSYVDTSPEIFRKYNFPVSVEVIEGIAILAVLDFDETIKEFIIHRRVILVENMPFMIIPLTKVAYVEECVETSKPYKETLIPTKIQVSRLPIYPKFYITDIFAYYYNVKGQNYFFPGETHHYWEMTYVDTGEMVVEVDHIKHTLSNQMLMVYTPDQLHKHRIDPQKSCSFVTIMFDMKMNEEELELIKNKPFHCTQQMYSLVNDFIKQSNLFENYNQPYSRDIMISYLQELIIFMLQFGYGEPEVHISSTDPVQQKIESEMIDEIHKYVLHEINTPITIQEICDHFSISRSTLQTLFKKHLNIPPKEYINDLKMKHAQQIMTQENISVTEAAYRLGYSSIHYFSRKFKKEFGISPSEFLQAVGKQRLFSNIQEKS